MGWRSVEKGSFYKVRLKSEGKNFREVGNLRKMLLGRVVGVFVGGVGCCVFIK